MILGRVVGTLVSTQKEKRLEGLKLLVVEQTDLKGQPRGTFHVAVDAVNAGVGELVMMASGSSARQTDITKDKPVDTVIMSIVDQIHVEDTLFYDKAKEVTDGNIA